MTSPLHNRVCDMLGIEHPIFAFAHHEDVIVEAANAGAIGIFGGTRNTPSEIRDVLKRILYERLNGYEFYTPWHSEVVKFGGEGILRLPECFLERGYHHARSFSEAGRRL